MNKVRQRQSGIAIVEFAIVGAMTFVVLIGVIEVGRVFFVLNALEEATRRGARVAAVCEVNDPAIADITVFSSALSPGNSTLVGGLTSGNVVVEYLTSTGAAIADPMADYGDIAFVRVRIVNYQHQLLIPIVARTFTVPPFATTLPRESLGVYPTGTSTC